MEKKTAKIVTLKVNFIGEKKSVSFRKKQEICYFHPHFLFPCPHSKKQVFAGALSLIWSCVKLLVKMKLEKFQVWVWSSSFSCFIRLSLAKCKNCSRYTFWKSRRLVGKYFSKGTAWVLLNCIFSLQILSPLFYKSLVPWLVAKYSKRLSLQVRGIHELQFPVGTNYYLNRNLNERERVEQEKALLRLILSPILFILLLTQKKKEEIKWKCIYTDF